ncbi:hypothetical protein NDU88_000627 [Pleurodeles waltl]|uniref:Uncharacterized protein n=1 Tax=Pleurodeles waltl TaxID=8319 RepID=A0AAV7URL4_PLEWA|nr:hypothetical protein NDU88_000627 [Pleurodeles waltl]
MINKQIRSEALTAWGAWSTWRPERTCESELCSWATNYLQNPGVPAAVLNPKSAVKGPRTLIVNPPEDRDNRSRRCSSEREQSDRGGGFPLSVGPSSVARGGREKPHRTADWSDAGTTHPSPHKQVRPQPRGPDCTCGELRARAALGTRRPSPPFPPDEAQRRRYRG